MSDASKKPVAPPRAPPREAAAAAPRGSEQRPGTLTSPLRMSSSLSLAKIDLPSETKPTDIKEEDMQRGASKTVAEKLNYSSMTYDTDLVYNHVKNGVEQVAEVKKIVTRLTRLEQDYAKRMGEAIAVETKRLSELMELDKLIMISAAWEALVNSLKARVDSSQNLVANIQKEVLQPLTVLEKTVNFSLNDVQASIKKTEGDFAVSAKKSADALNKSKSDCAKAFHTLQTAAEKCSEADLKKKDKLNDALSTVRSQAAELAKVYDAKVKDANENSTKFQTEICLHLDHLQQVEHQRLRGVVDGLGTWMNLVSEADSKLAKTGAAVVNYFQKHSPQSSINLFIADWVQDFGEPSFPPPYTYELALTASDIEQGYLPTGLRTFGLSMPELIAREALGATKPSPEVAQAIAKYRTRAGMGGDEKVPLILYTLVEAVRKLGGLTAEGIFRISVDSGALLQLQRQFDGGDFSLEAMKGDPHMAACLLKLWLRSLTEPVIPRAQYQEATKGLQNIQVTRRETRMSVSGDMGSAEDSREKEKHQRAEAMEKLVMSIISSLAPCYQAATRIIVDLAAEIVKHEETRMTYEALAVVFAPCFFQSPEGMSGIELMQASQYMKAFMLEMFTVLAKKWST